MAATIYAFGFGGKHPGAEITKDNLGGKGHGLILMEEAGINTPPGFIVPTGYSKAYNQAKSDTERHQMVQTVCSALKTGLQGLKSKMGHMPLLSVRSGAPVSMPGMMDTILNVGLTTGNIEEWSERIGTRAAWDSYRRLIQMLSCTAYEMDHGIFEKILDEAKEEYQVETDAELSAEALCKVATKFTLAFQAAQQMAFPDTLTEQLTAAVRAVFASWVNDRAIAYREMNGISNTMGTAIVVQAMVFGNMGDTSGTGVLFTRNPSTGEPGMYGEFLINAQGEDVVAGIRTPMDLWDMNCVEYQDTCWPDIYKQIEKVCSDLEGMYRDMVDIEFTVQQGKLYLLQSRTGKRSALAAFVIARDMVDEGVISRDEALSRLTPTQYKLVSRPIIPPSYDVEPHFKGLPASPGVASGIAVFSSDQAVEHAKIGEKVLLITHETTPDDIAGMKAAEGILTATGGATSHAAVVARGMDKPCVVGATGLVVGDGQAQYEGWVIKDGVKVTIDGTTGRVWIAVDVPVIDASSHSAVADVMSWVVPEDCVEIADKPMEDCSFAIDWFRLVALPDAPKEMQRLLGTANDHKVFISFIDRKKVYGQFDHQLGSIWGKDPVEEQLMNDLLNATEANSAIAQNIVCLHVNDAHLAQKLSLRGMSVMAEAKTLHDYLKNPYAFADASFISDILGGPDMIPLLEDLHKTHGVEKKTVPQMYHPRTTLFTRLATTV